MFLCAAAIAGAVGVHHGVSLLKDESSRDMAMLGICSLDQMTAQLLVPARSREFDLDWSRSVS